MARKKAASPVNEVIPTKGEVCPNCGQVYVPASFNWYMMFSEENAEKPHENPFDCIRELRRQIEEMAWGIKRIREGGDVT